MPPPPEQTSSLRSPKEILSEPVAESSSPSSAKINNAWSLVSTPPL
jgi:hypothetical protein